MYLDNVIKSAQAASMPEITYSEIVEDSLRMVEVEGAGQLALLKAEASAHILGSEAPSDWWAKIKTVARKIFEMLKNLITKVFAFIKSLPTKIGTLITRLLTKWEKLGMKSKVERIFKKDGSSKIRYATAQDVRDREFSPLYGSYNGFAESYGVSIRAAIGNWTKATETYVQKVGDLSKDDNDRLEEELQKEKEELIAAENRYKDALHDFKQISYKPFDTVFKKGGTVKEDTVVPPALIKIITDGWGLLKNRTIEKQAEKEIRDQENGTRDAASSYRKLMATYERYVRDEDENGVRNALEAARNLRMAISGNSRIAAQVGSLIYKDALTVAKIVNAAISCCKGGDTKSDKTFH